MLQGGLVIHTVLSAQVGLVIHTRGLTVRIYIYALLSTIKDEWINFSTDCESPRGLVIGTVKIIIIIIETFIPSQISKMCFTINVIIK